MLLGLEMGGKSLNSTHTFLIAKGRMLYVKFVSECLQRPLVVFPPQIYTSSALVTRNPGEGITSMSDYDQNNRFLDLRAFFQARSRSSNQPLA